MTGLIAPQLHPLPFTGFSCMRHQLFSVRHLWVAIAIAAVWLWGWSQSAIAGSIDPYVLQYLKAANPVELQANSQGQTQTFTPEDLTEGKALFKQNCLNCHVGGATLPSPTVSLSLDALAGATPPRDSIEGLVNYMRVPMTYDGSEENYFCREVPESWMSQTQVDNLAAFILRAAQKAPGWGAKTF
ncbi:photosystem II cytochrome PsbV2 [Geitlerinema splendidum]|nr:photosystem II cytochrome PsbV2 [Geitlerinema splendidum]